MSDWTSHEILQALDLHHRAELCKSVGFHAPARLLEEAAALAEKKAQIFQKLEEISDHIEGMIP